MRGMRPCVLLCASLLIVVSVSAQQSTSTSPLASDPQAVAVIQKSLAALTSGVAVTDVAMSGTARRIAGTNDETGSATLEGTSAGDSRVELSFASGNRVEIRNHSAAPLANTGGTSVALPSVAMQPQPVGAWSGSDGVLHPISQQNTLTEAAWFFPALVVEGIAESPLWILRYVGPETRDGVSVIHIQAAQQIPSAADAPPQVVDTIRRLTCTDLYLDSNSLLPIAIEFNTHPQNNALLDIPTEIRFSSYQPVSGVAVPMHVEKYLNNSLVLDLQLSHATINPGLSASAFALQ